MIEIGGYTDALVVFALEIFNKLNNLLLEAVVTNNHSLLRILNVNINLLNLHRTKENLS